MVEGARLLALAHGSRSLSPLDRVGLVSNAWAEVRQGAIGVGVFLDMLPAFDTESNRYVVEQIAGAIGAIDIALVEPDARGAFRRWVIARMAARKKMVGWEDAHTSESKDRAQQEYRAQQEDDRTMMRGTVLWVMAELGGDNATLDEAEGYATKWLTDPASVNPDTAAIALGIASMKAGAARLAQLRAAAANAKTPEDRALAIRAMGTFDDPALLRKALDLALTDELKLSEIRYLVGSALNHRAAWSTLYAWEKENWNKLRAHLPGSLRRGMLIQVAGTMCTPTALEDARAFFVPATREIEGVKRPLDEALESAVLCVALREHGAAEVTQYLRRK
jgi:aminopeptidase N/puromycin-sensitive aminopeptidase